ncbi:hypothetical protein SAMD00019534_082750 [Acytostelium subglobosum LB1]|uniref:hypothetical protein n=1 Tax=Acytostelium subglobosum LB1 TaxID=1410327 RepID=UPI0006450F73|nr:hypothetical protein SAMD00019534_082750 [Acytostelium subglobosum LB1]GAM25100.1 hypothetical protein SAMD00019534_082750 [Acytostelium subglobosum LB1]|eukprot:XP_012752189.1 hypothetical protein SAMD00019534_082750 [Acytostelium subglobosum LB1]
MECGGNKEAKKYFTDHGIINSKIEEKYDSTAAATYKKLLEAKALKSLNESDSLDISLAPLSMTQHQSEHEDGHDHKQSHVVTLTDDNEWDNFESSKNTLKGSGGNSVKKTGSAKKITKQSFDDDWDSIPETVVAAQSSKKSGGNSGGGRKSQQEDQQHNDHQQEDEEEPRFSKSSKFSMEPLHDSSDNKSSSQQHGKKSRSTEYASTDETEYEPLNRGDDHKKSTNYQETDYARKNFGEAKSISSQHYFGNDQDSNDPDKQVRLSKFAGATSISSAQYYDRNESPHSLSSYSAGKYIPAQATEIASSLYNNIANTDIKSLSSAVLDGSKKLTSMATSMANNAYQYGNNAYRQYSTNR